MSQDDGNEQEHITEETRGYVVKTIYTEEATWEPPDQEPFPMFYIETFTVDGRFHRQWVPVPIAVGLAAAILAWVSRTMNTEAETAAVTDEDLHNIIEQANNEGEQ